MNPLHNVRVLEYGGGTGAAYAANLLAQLGSHVTKVVEPRDEPPTEQARIRRRAEDLYVDDRKERVAGPLTRDRMSEYVADAHIVVRGCDPYHGSRDAKVIEEEHALWRSVNENVVFVAVTPFGVRGRGAGWHGGDLHAQGLSGWTYLVGNPDEPPLSMNYGVGALQQGLGAAAAAVAALLERGTSGGDFVDVAESDVVAAAMRMYSMTYRFLEIPLRRQGLRAPGSSGRYPHTLLPCKDGYVSMIFRAQIEWDRFMDMIGHPDWAKEPRYQDFYAMGTEYPDEVDALLIPWLMQHTKDDLAEMAARYRVPLAPVRSVDEVLEDPQLQHREFFRTAEDGGDRVLVPGDVARWNQV